MWRSVSEFPGYEVSDRGVVRNSKGKHLKHWVQNSGYKMATMTKDGKACARLVHRLVAIAFLGDAPFAGAHVAHGDGNKMNNVLPNLRWVSRSDNEKDKWKHGRMANGERHGAAKFTDQQIAGMKRMRRSGAKLREVVEVYGSSISHVSQVCAGLKRRNPTCEVSQNAP